VHRLVDSGGDVVQFKTERGTIRTGLTGMLALKALHGAQIYYVPHYHDPDVIGTYPTSDYVIRGILLVQQGGMSNVDPPGTYWNVQFEVVDNGTVT
jgi:hypothetical protein